jgi:hypothetical protein
MASKSVIGLESSNGFERNKATLLGGPSGNRRGISRDSHFGVLPSRVAVFAAFKKNPQNQLLAFGFQLSAFCVPELLWCMLANSELSFVSAASFIFDRTEGRKLTAESCT